MASFGVEIELLIKPLAGILPLLAKHGHRPNNIPRLNMIAVHKTLVEVLTERSFPAELYNEDSDYQEKWQVTGDASIRSNDDDFGKHSVAFSLFDRTEPLTMSILSRGGDNYLHFPAITALIPSGRRGTDWCHANAEVVPELRAKYMAGRPVLLAWIEGFSDKSELWENISPKKTVAWNFRNAREGGCGTVEFRQPPGVVSNAATKRWVAIALALFAAGIEPWLAYPVAAPTVEDLKIVLEHSASRIGVSHLLSFDGASEQTIPINTLSAEEREYITLLKAQKPSIFAENLERRGGRGSSP
ncbi:uncharacterized protein ARB_01542 [Trichophyton benhamiae CBS 112371]|uniref:Uncharacterized protein n=1 Tax=Arthroderma benhamiae (strain ATCC MYA-4681 / CBS 112371) TaxID=663331 RepID=D4AZC2_ARTBC|nr:uncharacterized protein ARB_01542 [Trichophyton benhamiae CBS 112371]EFE31642.1 hypothetical protein ARB_01542 [Trichophyton benhamiae CBS 112371]